ncbi:hypothetical protein QQS21_012166 [Conoideocrella luteorostrata]|uniref:Choline transport protein n=1 Tax=Conoideocrella luteorostrata TaxID=1105319 RepID=A0AAJ0CC15_9HYPO|nr:hypothetical protein QQS21_012166 [Conoideocrella luteorostrata]
MSEKTGYSGDTATSPIVCTVSNGCSSQEDADNNELTRLGKKAALKRNFSFLAILGFGCTILQTWEATLTLFSQGLVNGGPAGIIYGYMFIWIGNMCVFSTLSELASMAPTSGGQYHWVAMLAPKSISTFLSYITGWLVVAGWQGATASALYIGASLVQSFLVLTVREYQSQTYHLTLLFWACLAPVLFLNAWSGRILATFETLILVVHLTAFVAVMTALVALSPHADAAEVFTTFMNGGGWPSQGLSVFVGLIGNVFAFVGVDGAFHMSEETRNPSIAIPRTTMIGLFINGSLGFAMILAVVFCMGDPEKAIQSPYVFPFVAIFLQSTGSVAGTAALSCVLWILGLAATIGIFASTSRVLWSFARDHGVPGWRVLSKVHPSISIPVWSIACTASISFLLSLVNLGSTIAFNNVVSLAVSCLYASYLIAAALLLYRRCTGGFKKPDTSEGPLALANTAGARLVWGPWRISGVFGIMNNAIACCYLIIILIFAFFPPDAVVDASSMNYSILVTGVVAIIAILYYVVWGKRMYRGPIIET